MLETPEALEEPDEDETPDVLDESGEPDEDETADETETCGESGLIVWAFRKAAEWC